MIDPLNSSVFCRAQCRPIGPLRSESWIISWNQDSGLVRRKSYYSVADFSIDDPWINALLSRRVLIPFECSYCSNEIESINLHIEDLPAFVASLSPERQKKMRIPTFSGDVELFPRTFGIRLQDSFVKGVVFYFYPFFHGKQIILTKNVSFMCGALAHFFMLHDSPQLVADSFYGVSWSRLGQRTVVNKIYSKPKSLDLMKIFAERELDVPGLAFEKISLVAERFQNGYSTGMNLYSLPDYSGEEPNSDE